MKADVKIQVRAYAVMVRDERTGEVSQDLSVLDKARVQAAQLVGMNDEDLIHRTYNRKGYRVLDIVTPPRKVELTVDLEKIFREQAGEV